jgi:hypothetical protein
MSDDKIGYRRPPKAHQFQPGKSGNPAGRPKGAKSIRADLEAMLIEPETVRVDGKPSQVTKQQALLLAIVSRALTGNMRACELILRFADRERSTIDSQVTQEDRTAFDEAMQQHIEREVQKRLQSQSNISSSQEEGNS